MAWALPRTCHNVTKPGGMGLPNGSNVHKSNSQNVLPFSPNGNGGLLYKHDIKPPKATKMEELSQTHGNTKIEELSQTLGGTKRSISFKPFIEDKKVFFFQESMHAPKLLDLVWDLSTQNVEASFEDVYCSWIINVRKP